MCGTAYLALAKEGAGRALPMVVCGQMAGTVPVPMSGAEVPRSVRLGRP
jgi:hypothetical protein